MPLSISSLNADFDLWLLQDRFITDLRCSIVPFLLFLSFLFLLLSFQEGTNNN